VIRTGTHQALDELREVIGVLRDDLADGAPGGGAPGGGAPDDGAPDGGSPDSGAGRPQPTLADLPRLVDESREASVPVRLDNQVCDPSTVPAGTGRPVVQAARRRPGRPRTTAAA
jgi:hypothetical protein